MIIHVCPYPVMLLTETRPAPPTLLHTHTTPSPNTNSTTSSLLRKTKTNRWGSNYPKRFMKILSSGFYNVANRNEPPPEKMLASGGNPEFHHNVSSCSLCCFQSLLEISFIKLNRPLPALLLTDRLTNVLRRWAQVMSYRDLNYSVYLVLGLIISAGM